MTDRDFAFRCCSLAIACAFIALWAYASDRSDTLDFADQCEARGGFPAPAMDGMRGPYTCWLGGPPMLGAPHLITGVWTR